MKRPKKPKRRAVVRVAESVELKADEWISIPSLPPPTARTPIPERPEEQVRTASAVALLFALLLGPGYGSRDHKWEWWTWCQSESCNYPMGSYSNVFWWSLRTLGDYKSAHDLNEFHEYFVWKWNEYESKRLRREGPRWA